MAAYRRVYDSLTCRLTAKNRDQFRNPTLGNRVWATFTTKHTFSVQLMRLILLIIVVAVKLFVLRLRCENRERKCAEKYNKQHGKFIFKLQSAFC